MKKLIVSVAIIGAFAIYVLTHGRASASSGLPGASGTGALASSPTTTTDGGTPAAGALFKNGSYTGVSADAQWGYVQVQAIIQNGKLADVKFLQYPNHRSRSVEINTYAMPVLTSEAVQAQSAQVDVVSGATDTAFAFMQSLDDALTQAKA
ncbi:MAG TPA: FMN-binding protein [Ktedonobacterales bacterium]